MSEILSRIRQDHRNMSRLLDVLETQIADLAAGSDHHYRLTSDIVDYFNHYPTTSHHPLEDEIFDWVSRGRPGLFAVVAELHAEHVMQMELGREIAMFMHGIVGGHMVPRARIVADLGHYAAVQRRHIDKEEGVVLKETERLLIARNLTEIPLQSGAHTDPLFGQEPDSAYAALLEALADR